MSGIAFVKNLNRKETLKFVLLFIVIISGILIYNHFEIGKLLTRENIEPFLKSFGAWVPVVYLSLFIFAMFFNAPASVFLITAGTIFGPLWGALWGITGCYLAAIIVFLLARVFDFKAIEKRFGDKWEKFNKHLEEDGFFYVAIARSSLLFPFSLISYASAVTSIKLKDYLKGTFIGCVPVVLVHAYLVPMLISQSLTAKYISILFVVFIMWLAVFGVFYSSHKKRKTVLIELT